MLFNRLKIYPMRRHRFPGLAGAIFILGLLLLCEHRYRPISPREVFHGEARFMGQAGIPRKTQFLYSAPPNYRPDQALPLLIALHGGGGYAAEFHDLWKSAADSFGMILLTPQGEIRSENGMGWSWGPDAEMAVLISLEILGKTVNLDSRHVFLAGFSAGGRVAYLLSFQYPQLFEGVAALSAPFKPDFLSRNKVFLNQVKYYISHGELESEIAAMAIRAAQELKARGLPVESVEYAGLGHDLPQPHRRELNRILHYLMAPVGHEVKRRF